MEAIYIDRERQTVEPTRKGIRRIRFRTRHLLLAMTAFVALPYIENSFTAVKKKMPYALRARQALSDAEDGNNDYVDMLHVRRELMAGELQPWMVGYSHRSLLQRFKQALENDIAAFEASGRKGETEAAINDLNKLERDRLENSLQKPLSPNWLEDMVR